MKFRKLKSHERRLVKKADFFNWKSESSITKKLAVINFVKEYGLSGNDEYGKYSAICTSVNKVIMDLLKMKSAESDVSMKRFIDDQLDLIFNKLYAMGVLESTKEFKEQFTKHGIHATRYLRRRLNYVMMHELGMGENIKNVNQYIRDGHVKVGPKIVTDPAFLVTRTLEDYVSWVGKSKIRETILRYNNTLDDYDIQNC